MSGPSNLVSVRIPDDELALLDQHVGTQGMRSRSDVIRRALRSLFESQPTHEAMISMVVELGTAQQFKLAHLHQVLDQQNYFHQVHIHLDKVFLIPKLPNHIF